MNYTCGLFSVRAHDKRIACEEEFSDSEDEAEGQGGGRRNAANHKKAKRVKKEEEKEGEEKKGKTCLQHSLVFIDELNFNLINLSCCFSW